MRWMAGVFGSLCLGAVIVAGSAVTADGSTPKGSAAEVMFETGAKGPLCDPGYAIVDGWWGHEGADHTGTTYFSLNGAGTEGAVSTASMAFLHQALGGGNSFDDLRVAFVPASSDGSTERPLVHAGEFAGDAFKWWTDQGMGSGVAGSAAANDYGTFISTQTQWDAFWNAGRPLQSFDSHLAPHDVSTNAVSAAPEGTSILNTWPAGTKISVVLYVSDGYNNELEPTVKVGPDGRAIAAWLTIRTVAKPGDPVRTSAGYQVLTASAGEGSKLVNGMPPASATFNPGAATATGSTTATAHASSAVAGHQGRTHPGANGSQRTASHNTIASSVWTWVGLVAAAVAAGVVLIRRRSPGGRL